MNSIIKKTLVFLIILFTVIKIVSLSLSDGILADMRLAMVKDQEPLATKYLYKPGISEGDTSKIVMIRTVRDKEQVERFYKSGGVDFSISDYHKPPTIISINKNYHLLTCKVYGYVFDSTYAIVEVGYGASSAFVNERRFGYISIEYLHDTISVK